MRLSDHLLAARGSENDLYGTITKTANAIEQAERFELTDEVVITGYTLITSRPSTLAQALPLCRLPYSKMWIEWKGGIDHPLRNFRRDQSWAPEPIKLGCLIEADESGQRGTMTWAWLHSQKATGAIDMKRYPKVAARGFDPNDLGLNVCPLAIYFDWTDEPQVVPRVRSFVDSFFNTPTLRASPPCYLTKVLMQRWAPKDSDESIRMWMENAIYKGWQKFAADPREREAFRELCSHEVPFISPHAWELYCRICLNTFNSAEETKGFLRLIAIGWEPDIEGEAPFIGVIIAMMNSRNAMEHHPVDLTKLNRSRAKLKRPQFMSYRTTHLRLSNAEKRAIRDGVSNRLTAGYHKVRGHFKIRRTGIWWWNKFYRGDPTRPLERGEYKVQA